MHGLETSRQRAFSVWLRTGRRMTYSEGRKIEHKFNPNHDPSNGQFTFGDGGHRAPKKKRADGAEAVRRLWSISKKLNSYLHLRQIRSEWDNFYKGYEAQDIVPRVRTH